jgi:hypothetical protein
LIKVKYPSSTLTVSELALLAESRCDKVKLDEYRGVPGYSGFSFVCCGDSSQSPPLVEDVYQVASVEADANAVIVFERVVRGSSGSPIVINIVTIK